ncbi:GTP-binding protein rho1-like protein [Serendipita vermifera]|nr:GTP-binding protein rho1-like protein [Serendipita vermifera]
MSLKPRYQLDQHMSGPLRRKLVVVGDKGVGKSFLLTTFRLGYFPEEYIPTFRENCVADMNVAEKIIQLALWDTGGHEYDRLRQLAYLDAHVILICFSVESPDSLEHVEQRWVPEVRRFCPTSPVILVACKTDLRGDTTTDEGSLSRGQTFVSREEGENTAKLIGASAYLECSAKREEGVIEVLQTAANIVSTLSPERKFRNCVVI